DIIGMWEGVEMTGEETYGDANHRIEYKADGTYVYYDKDGDDWKLSEDVDNEYNVDGDWLASRWRPKAGEDFEYEWWDIVEIKDGTMKWSALREKEDGTRYTTTFTWKKIQ
ncbi:MAG: lipocalin family protein, partial [Paludibacteraceae bacterium]|nr:lipocalin family protein [Paludibacteraceae bacterium]